MTTVRLNLCLNCLQPGARGVNVGPEKGSQRDPYHDSVQLCPVCEEALLEGNFEVLASRFTNSREVGRGESMTSSTT